MSERVVFYEDEYNDFYDELMVAADEGRAYFMANEGLARAFLDELKKEIPAVDMYELGNLQYFIINDKQRADLLRIIKKDIAEAKGIINNRMDLYDEVSGADQDFPEQVLAKMKTEGIEAILTQTPEGVEAATMLLMFIHMEELITSGDLPDCKRFRDQALSYLKCNEKSLYYFYFMGFVSGVDFSQYLREAESEEEAEDIDTADLEYIKINLPETEEGYKEGYGEGCFCLVTPEVKAAYDADEDGTMYEGILDNDSVNYSGLVHGAKIPFEMRGTRRPVVPLEWLKQNYKENTEE